MHFGFVTREVRLKMSKYDYKQASWFYIWDKMSSSSEILVDFYARFLHLMSFFLWQAENRGAIILSHWPFFFISVKIKDISTIAPFSFTTPAVCVYISVQRSVQAVPRTHSSLRNRRNIPAFNREFLKIAWGKCLRLYFLPHGLCRTLSKTCIV